MNDPYEKVFHTIDKNISLLRDMIIELASRTLSAKECKEFAETINKKIENNPPDTNPE